MHDSLALTLASIALAVDVLLLAVGVLIFLHLSREAPQEPPAC